MNEIMVITPNTAGRMEGGTGRPSSSVVLRRTPVSLDDDPLMLVVKMTGPHPENDYSVSDRHKNGKGGAGTTRHHPVAFDSEEYSHHDHHHQRPRSIVVPLIGADGGGDHSRPMPDAIMPLKGLDDEDGGISFAALKPAALSGRSTSGGKSLRRCVSGGGVRHEALEELAASVHDLRAEVHGRPSLCERRFSGLRRNRSLTNINVSCRDLMAEIGGIMEALDEDDGGDGAAAAADGGRKGSFASFDSNGPLGGGGVASPVPQKGALPRFGGLRRQPSSSGGGRALSFRVTKDPKGSVRSIENVEHAPQTPHEAAERTTESVYGLVSVLYGLVDSRDVPPGIAGSVLDHTPAVDLAFGRIKPLISALAFESTFDESDHSENNNRCGGGGNRGNNDDGAKAAAAVREDDEDEESAELRRQLSAVSRLLDALAETVRHIAEIAPSLGKFSAEGDAKDENNKHESSNNNKAKDAAATDAEKAVAEAECAYVTLLELLGMKCSDLSQSNTACLTSDYAAADCMQAFGHSSVGSGGSSGLLFSRSRSSSSLFSLEFDGDEADKGSGCAWELSRSLRGSWAGTGHADKVRILEKHDVQHSSHGSGDVREGDRIIRVDPDLLRELSLLVLSGMGWTPERWRDAVNLAEDRTFLRRVRDGEKDSIGDAMTLCRLGDVKVSMKKYDDALASYEEALVVSRIRCDNAGPIVAAVHEAIGNVHRAKGRYDEADSSFHEALRAIKNGGGRLSTKDDDGARSTTEALLSLLLSLSHLESDRGEIEEALALLERRLAVQRDSSSSSSPSQLGTFSAAAASGVERPDDGPDVADTLYRMGSLCMDAGMDERAGRYFAEALSIRERTLGPDDPSVADALFALGLLRCAPSRAAAGKGKQRRGTDGRTPPPHRRPDEALELLWDSLRIRRRHGDRLKEAETLAVLGKIHRTMGQHETAVRLYGECLEIRVGHHQGMDHREVADVHVALGYVHKETGKWDEASRHFRAALSISEKIFGETDTRVTKLVRLLGESEFAAGNLPVARRHLERFVRLKKRSRRSSPGPGGGGEGDDYQGLDVVESLHVLGKIRHASDEFDGAREAYTEAQKIYALNDHADRRMSVGRELIESLRNLDAACSQDAFDESAAELSVEEEEISNPVRSFIMKVGRSMSMEHAAASGGGPENDSRMGGALSNVRAQQKMGVGHGGKSSMDMSPGIRTRSGSVESAGHARNGSMGHGRNGSMGHARNGSMSHGRKSGMGHSSKSGMNQQGRSGSIVIIGNGGSGRKSSMDMSSSSFGSGRKSSIGHAPRKSSMDMSSTSFGSSMGFGGKRSSMDHTALPASCPAVASGQKLNSSQASNGASQQPMMAKDHLWGMASQVDFNPEDLEGLLLDKDDKKRREYGSSSSEEAEGSAEKQPAGPDSDSTRDERGSPPLRPSPSIMMAMRAAHTSVRNTIIGIRDEAVQQPKL